MTINLLFINDYRHFYFQCVVFQRMLNKLDISAARSVDISASGEFIAVGLKNGGFMIVTAATFKPWAQKRDRGKMINSVL